MKTNIPEKIHYDPAKPCCADPTAADLFPDFLHLQMNALNKGRVFGVYLGSCGIGVQDREVVVDREALVRCSQTPDFRKFLELSVAKLSLEQAVLKY